MNQEQQPGIILEGVILVENEFKREHQLPEKYPFHVHFDLAFSYHENDTVMIAAVTATVNDPDAVVYMRMKFVARFRQAAEPNMRLQEFAESGAAVGIIIPYLRQLISDLSIRAGIRPMLLQPINVVALQKNAQQEEEAAQAE